MPAHPADHLWRWEVDQPLRWLLIDEQSDPESAVAVCAELEGLFTDAGEGQMLTLVGCRTEPPLRSALDALDRGAGNPGGALHRRRVNARIYSVAKDGTATRVIGGDIGASVCAVRPSVLGAGLLDVTFDAPLAEPPPTGAREIWELWRAGRPAEPGLWARYDRDLRHQWSRAALPHHRAAPDRVAGATFHLDGRGVTDVEGFFCAIGEAVNGPGGYFGSNLDALHDCVTGGWGATRPFRLVWHDAHIARARLGTVFDDLIHTLTADGVEVVPR